MEFSLVCLSLKNDFECSWKADVHTNDTQTHGVHTNDVLVRRWLQHFLVSLLVQAVMADKETLSGIILVMEIKFSVVLSLLNKLEAILDR